MDKTDESKLLPSDGVYAVSAGYETGVSKAMAVISTVSGNQRLWFHLSETDNDISGKNTTLLFHKKITGPVDLTNQSSSAKLKASLDEISELVY
jgi:FAD synthase